MFLIDQIVRDVAAVGTCIGVVVAATALSRQARQAKTEFEDDLAREYREIIRRLPPQAILGDPPIGHPARQLLNALNARGQEVA
jgi:hypothetical protein